MSTMNSPASAQTKRMFFMLFSLALAMASRTASRLTSTPSTCPAVLAAIMPIVPMPQYASMTVSRPVSPANSIALP